MFLDFILLCTKEEEDGRISYRETGGRILASQATNYLSMGEGRKNPGNKNRQNLAF